MMANQPLMGNRIVVALTIKRDKFMPRGEKLFYYLIFIIFAAPAEIVVSIGLGLNFDDPQYLWKPLSHALLYLYAFVLVSETWFRLATHKSNIDPLIRAIIMAAAAIVVILFMGHYLLALAHLVEEGVDVTYTWPLQLGVLALAFAISAASFYIVENSPSAGGVLLPPR